MANSQSGILAPIPPLARYVTYNLLPGTNPRKTLAALSAHSDGNKTVAGLGFSLVSALQCGIDELRTFPEFSGYGIDIPSTPAALWLWLRGDDRGEIVNRHRALDDLLARFWLGGELEIHDHECAGMLSQSPRQYTLWQLAPGRFHLVEWLRAPANTINEETRCRP